MSNKTFRLVDKMVADSLPDESSNVDYVGNFFTYAKAGLYGINVLPTVTVERIAENSDIYAMLEEPSADIRVSAFDGFGVLTAGWAAPIVDGEDEPNVPPSQHPERVRVRLFSYCDHDGVVHSSCRFADGREMAFDENQARGAMRDAMADLYEASQAFKKIFEQ